MSLPELEKLPPRPRNSTVFSAVTVPSGLEVRRTNPSLQSEVISDTFSGDVTETTGYLEYETVIL